MEPLKSYPFLESIPDFRQNPIPGIKPELIPWKVHFDFAYYLGISPFRFEWNQSMCQWEIRKSSTQRVICFILLVFEILNFLVKFVGRVYPSTSDPNLYFFALSTIASIFSMSAIRLVFWRNSQLFFNTMNTIQNSRSEQTLVLSKRILVEQKRSDEPGSNNISLIIISKTICTAMIAITLLSYIRNYIANAGVGDGSASLDKTRNEIRKVFNLENSAEVHDSLVFSKILLEIHTNLTNGFTDVLFILTSLLFHDMVNQFLTKMRNQKFSPIQVMNLFYGFKNNMALVNRATGIINFGFSLGSLPLYCDVMYMYILPMSLFSKVYVTVYSAYLIVTLALPAEAHKKMGEVYNWLYLKGNYRKIPHPDLHAFLHDISQNNIGLNASGFSVISQSFLGTMLGLAVTYTVVIVQFRTQKG